jgi:8-oxo-dGTP pyrophosphatase MutT (NUDIX family)
VEASDTSLESAARRELAEETGIEDAVALVADIPVHIDRHTIPSNPSKGEGEHDHWDVRFLFTCPSSDVSIQLDEVSGFQWREISLLPSALAARVAECMKP